MDFTVVFRSCHARKFATRCAFGGSGVPRYFFHFSDGKRQFTDDTGEDLSGISAAREHAVDHVREIIAATSDKEIHDFSGWSMTVVDGNGKIVSEIGFDLKPLRPKL
jgi:hypothetical protein